MGDIVQPPINIPRPVKSAHAQATDAAHVHIYQIRCAPNVRPRSKAWNVHYANRFGGIKCERIFYWRVRLCPQQQSPMLWRTAIHRAPAAAHVQHTGAIQVITEQQHLAVPAVRSVRQMQHAPAAMVQLLYAIRDIIKAALPVRAVRHRAECTARPSPRGQRP